MKNIAKQAVGFKFGQHRLEVLQEFGKVEHKGRIYKLVQVKTEAGDIYNSLRLYNRSGKFIKQMLFEPEIQKALSMLLRPRPELPEAVKRFDAAMSLIKRATRV